MRGTGPRDIWVARMDFADPVPPCPTAGGRLDEVILFGFMVFCFVVPVLVDLGYLW